MAPHWIAIWQTRVIEILGRITGHAQLLHHSPRPRVAGDSEGDQIVDPQGLKGVAHDRLSSFGRKSLAPMFGRQSPADFDAWSERSVKTGDGQANKADERVILAEFGCK